MPRIDRSIVTGLLTAAVMLLATDLSADNWPEFRGPTGQGHAMAVDLPTQWNDATNVRFKQAVPGHGWSSPVVYDGQVFLTTAVSLSPEDDPAADQSLRVLCLDAADGHVHWQAEVFQLAASDISAHKKNSHASPTPLVDNGHVYVHFGPHGTAKLDLAGKIVWAKKPFSYDPVHGTGSSPMLADGKLIINCDGGDRAFVAALNPQDGTVVWTTPRPPAESRSFSFCTPLAITVAGRTQVVSPGSHVVCSYDPTTGDELWRVRYPNKWSIVPRPVYSHGLVFVCTGYEGPAALLAIRPEGQGDVTDTHIAWQVNKFVPYNPSMLAVDDVLYAVSDNGIATAREIESGRLIWRHRLGGNYSASPIFADGKIYMLSEEGICTVIEPGNEYRELATNDFGERTFASFAVTDSAIIARTENHLYRIEALSRGAD